MGFFIKHSPVLSILLIASLISGCNKDEEIIIENPEPEQSASFKVIEYLPAPGQFINEPASGYADVTTMDEACEYAQNRISKSLFVSLGGWGGYIVVKSPTPIKNLNTYEFSIGSNAFTTSNEPGIVWVMQDTNGNGLPDDEWFELKGSEYGKPGFVKDYEVTYYKSGPGEAIRWEDSLGNSGTIDRVDSYHSQETYFPLWVDAESYTLHGSLLPPNAVQNSTTGEWTTLPFKWGYADNLGDDSIREEVNGVMVLKNYFRISDAVKADGSAANLSTIDFIKVQTGVNTNCGWLGEVSTEVCGFFIENL